MLTRLQSYALKAMIGSSSSCSRTKLSYLSMSTSSSSSNSNTLINKIDSVILDKGKARLFKDGNPIVYGGAVKTVVGTPSAGSEVLVSDHQGNTIGRGFYNPNSLYRVRMFVQKKETSLFDLSLEDIIRTRIQRAQVN